MSELQVLLYSNLMVLVMKLTVFVVGYLTIKLGHNLLLAGVKGEFKFSANIGGTKADLVSVSPGLLFVLLGVLLIGYALFVEKTYYFKRDNSMPINAVTLPIAPSPFETNGSAISKDGGITGNQ